MSGINTGSFVGSLAGAFLGTNAASNTSRSTSSYLKTKPNFFANMFQSPKMKKDQYSDTMLKEMFFESDARNTVFYKYVAPGVIIGLIIIIIMVLILSGVLDWNTPLVWVFLGSILAGTVILTPLIYWWYCHYKMRTEWSANKSQIVTAMFSAFSGETQKLDTSIAEGTYLTELISVSNNDGKSAAMTKLSNDMEKDNDQALGVWLKYAAESE
jgi:hypothetical protein